MTQTVVSFGEVGFRYLSGRALDGLCLRAAPGETVGPGSPRRVARARRADRRVRPNARAELWAALRTGRPPGGTLVFATSEVAEAADHADRVVVLAAGTRLADGAPDEIRRLVPGRTVSVELSGTADPDELAALPGVVRVRTRGGRAYLSSTDADATVLALGATGWLRDVEVVGTDPADAFDALADGRRPAGPARVPAHDAA